MKHEISLDDKYTRRDGYAYMKGVQALARVMLEQQWRDRAAGHNTAGIVSGYRGSPLGAFDHVMTAAKSQLDANHIHFTPGLNEDLAANVIWGAQQVTLFPSATRDGVYGMWYGKGPGVDRCGDVFKHGNSSGSSRLGGVLCIAGDDHNAESSTLPHQTEDEFMSAGMPVIFPAGVKEFIEFGLFGIARGLAHIIVVEEKRSLIEWQLKTILYDQPGPHPRVVGKKDESGAILFQSHNAMTSLHIAQQLATQLAKIAVPLEMAADVGLPATLQDMQHATDSLPQGNLLNRRPFYCSGCPHNRSTLAPEGSRVLAGIGCHTMAMWMPRHTDLMPQMGGEGRETPFGRKRQINQASCNKDITCTEGFCPSFVLIKGGEVKRESLTHDAFESRIATQISSLAEPVARSKDANLLICGTGGTGVITLGAILGVAATLDGKFMLGLDQTGLAQKGGTTASHVRIFSRDENRSAARIPVAGADTLIGCDLVVAANLQMLERVRPDHTTVILNEHLSPVADFVENNDTVMDAEALICRIQTRAGEQQITQLNANLLAEKLFGDTLYANMMLLGYALQSGCVPLSLGAMKRAIELNRVDIARNLKALDFGRLLYAQPAVAQEIVPNKPVDQVSKAPLPQRIETLAAELAAYQNAAYAQRYRQLLEQAQAGLAAKGLDDSSSLLRVIAENAYKLMAYKDEYEVARLYTSGPFMKEIQQSFSGGYRLEFLFAPPWTRAGDRPRKLSFGPWMMPVLKLLARLRAVRGSVIDPLGYSAERRIERQLIADYRNLVVRVIEEITPERTEAAARLLAFPQDIKGFGHVKRNSLAKAQVAFQATWKDFSAAPAAAFEALAPVD